MFAKKREGRRQQNASGERRNLSQFGLLDTGDMDFDPDNLGSFDDDEDDENLEAELLALTSGKNTKVARKPRGVRDMNVLNSAIADSLKDIPSDDEDDNDSDLENDPALLAELQQLTPEDEEMPESENTRGSPPLPQRAAPPVPPPRTAPPIPPHQQTANNEKQDDSNTGSGGMSVVQIIEERISAYKTAVSVSKTLGETSKIKRFERGLKTLESLLKSAKNGKPINEDEIPPMVATGVRRPPQPPPSAESTIPEQVIPTKIVSAETEEPSKPSDPPPLIDFNIPTAEEQVPTDDNSASNEVHNVLTTRRDQYKQAALAAKRAGDASTAIAFVKIAKQFDNVIAALEQGQPIDLTQMPPAPPGFGDTNESISAVTRNSPQTAATENSSLEGSAPAEQEVPTSEEPVDESALFNAPTAPTTVLEALEQRLEKYQSSQKEAQEQGNGSKARRMGRIVKQYQDAIKLHKAGKPVAYDDLPAPPGFGPIPHGNGPAPQAPPLKPSLPSAPAAPPPQVPAPSAENDLPPSEKTSDSTSKSGPSGSTPPPLPPRQRPSQNRATVKRNPQSLHEKQLLKLEERQRLFKEAALQAKKRGDLQAAKEYLRQSKGFAPMIEASKCGLPINIDSAPIPPQLQREDSFEVVEYEDCVPPGDRDEAYEKLEQDLKTQIAMCTRNTNHFTQLGDVSTAQKFRILAEHSKKDLSAVKYAFKRGDAVPRFHYETRTFSIIQCFTDLTDNDLELTIVRGINYSCSNPKEIDTYVKFEFPYPNEAPPRDRTSTVKDTNNPEYNKTFVLSINRKARSMTRVFKRGSIKFEVIAKGGFFRSDSLLGTVNVKLCPLETKCLIHDSFDLMDGRKVVGGKLEIKVRIREPLLTKQLEEINEKWLVIDQYK